MGQQGASCSGSDSSSRPLPDPATTQPPRRPIYCLTDLLSEAPNWGCALVTDHLDPLARLALFATCTTTYRLVLDSAAHAFVKMHNEPSISMGTLKGVKAALQTRGKLRTELRLSAVDPTLLVIALVWLDTSIEWLDKLTVEVPETEHGIHLFTLGLTYIGRCCPHLRSLTLLTPSGELPTPDLFPHLTHLEVYYSFPVSYNRITACAPYVPQLNLLSIKGRSLPWQALPVLLNPTNMGTHLRTLHLILPVGDYSMGMLLHCAPVLEDLTIERFDLETDVHARTVAPWRRLACTALSQHLTPVLLARLPLAPNMDLDLTQCDTALFICDMTTTPEAALAAVAGRFKALTFTDISCAPCETVDVADQPAALRAGLAVLRTYRFVRDIGKRNRRVAFTLQDGWVMSSQLMLQLRSLPSWGYKPTLWFGEGLTWLPHPQPYTPLLRLLPNTFTQVHIDTAADGLTDAQLESICLGAPVDRTADSPLRIVLFECAPEVVEAIQHRVELGPFPNVNVWRFEPGAWIHEDEEWGQDQGQG